MLSRLKKKLDEEGVFQLDEHLPIISFLKSVLIKKDSHITSIPAKGGGAALRNAYLAWRFGIEVKTAKEYVSRGNIARRNLPPDSTNAGSIRNEPLYDENLLPLSNPRTRGWDFSLTEDEIKHSGLVWKQGIPSS